MSSWSLDDDTRGHTVGLEITRPTDADSPVLAKALTDGAPDVEGRLVVRKLTPLGWIRHLTLTMADCMIELVRDPPGLRVAEALVQPSAGRSMSPIVDVPLNTAIADLDEGLRSLLRSDLRRHGFDGVEISFDAPSREWAGKLTGPAVNLFLYDLREARDRVDEQPRAARRRPALTTTSACSDLRGHRLDQGGRGRAPPPLAGPGDSVLSRPAARRRARRALERRARPRRDRGGTSARGQGGFLERRRRPVQGVDRLRRFRSRSNREPGSSAGRRCGLAPSACGDPTVGR